MLQDALSMGIDLDRYNHGMSHVHMSYTRVASLIVLVPSAVWGATIGAMILRDIQKEWHDLTLMTPLLFWLVTSATAVLVAINPPGGRVKDHAVRGVLEGTLLAYAWSGFIFLSTNPQQWSDGTFLWIAWMLSFCAAGLIFCSAGAAIHVAYAVLRQRAPRDAV